MKGAALATLLVLGACRTVASEVAIPEPMVFDLVRPLGAEKGEVEVNTLAILPLQSGDPTAPEVAPEVEVALDDGFALELELPIDEDGLYSVKGAGQWTLGANPETGFVHGTQAIVERVVEIDAWELTALYLPAWRFDERWSALAMIGPRGLTGSEVRDDVGLIANGTVFRELGPRTALALEVDSILLDRGGGSVLLMPQVSWRANERFMLQVGAGALYVDDSVTGGSDLIVPGADGWYPQAALRAILEF